MMWDHHPKAAAEGHEWRFSRGGQIRPGWWSRGRAQQKVAAAASTTTGREGLEMQHAAAVNNAGGELC